MNTDRSPDTPARSGSQGPPVLAIIGLLVTAAVALFVVSNRDQVEIEFILFTVQSRTWTALVVAIALGVILDRLFLAWWRRRR